MRATELDTPYELAEDAVERFRRDGFVHLRDVLSAETLERYGEEITARVLELNTMHLPLEERSTYDKAFLQVTNIWVQSEVARKLVFSRRLAQIATELLGTQGVRLYHDQALYKEPGGGITPWHVDQHYWPLSGELTVTAWIPFQARRSRWDRCPSRREARTSRVSGMPCHPPRRGSELASRQSRGRSKTLRRAGGATPSSSRQLVPPAGIEPAHAV